MAPFKSPSHRIGDRSPSGQRRSPGGRRDGRGVGYPMEAKTNEQRIKEIAFPNGQKISNITEKMSIPERRQTT
eukprot:4284107-Amphidinium_carterae.1